MSLYVVAIDFGTSRSAWAYAVKGKGEEAIRIRVPAENSNEDTAEKTNTAVLLDADNRKVLSFGRVALETFIEQAQDAADDGDDDDGPDVSPRPLSALSSLMSSGSEAASGGHLQPTPAATSMLFRWFKMELCKNRGYKTWEDPIATAEGGQTVPLLRVMAATLRHFKDDALKHLHAETGMPIDVGEVSWVITIPAIYDDFAKRFMRVAAHEAGITDNIDSPGLQLCLEPEAACLAVSVKEAPDISQAGTRTMILDCGGGTIDITTHEILSLEPLRLKELLPPTGGPWGSTYVDSEFMKWCRGFIGDNAYIKVRRTSAFYDILKLWEEKKLLFEGTEADRGIKISMLGFKDLLQLDKGRMEELRVAHNQLRGEDSDLHVSGQNFYVILPPALVRTFFKPVIDKISECLVEMKKDPSLEGLKYVFLVGGFAGSKLVLAAARTSFEGDGCRVIASLRPGVSIVKGAVLFANTERAFSRIARLTYGVRTTSKYDANNPEHVQRREKFPFFDEDGKERIYAFSTHINNGDDIPPGDACPKKTYLPNLKNQQNVMIRILASHKRDIRFPDKGVTFPRGEILVPLDMTVDIEKRAVEVEFIFGEAEFHVNCFRKTTGEKVGTATLAFFQEVEAC